MLLALLLEKRCFFFYVLYILLPLFIFLTIAQDVETENLYKKDKRGLKYFIFYIKYPTNTIQDLCWFIYVNIKYATSMNSIENCCQFNNAILYYSILIQLYITPKNKGKK